MYNSKSLGGNLMEELEICVGDSLDTVVKRLLEAKVEGKHVFCDFNGVKLYSDFLDIFFSFKFD